MKLKKLNENDKYGKWETLNFGGVVQKFRWIEPGRFMMGSPSDESGRDNDEIQHEVALSTGFWMADTACTQELWTAVMGENPSFSKGDQRPVETVNWDDCQEFLEKLNAKTDGPDFRLPTEAEWEYACRAGTTTPYSFGKTITEKQVNFESELTVPVKEFPANPWGLYQMHGNVWELCSDYYEKYDLKNTSDPTGPERGELRVLRGGSSWFNYGRNVRSASRAGSQPDFRFDYIGFRLARGHE